MTELISPFDDEAIERLRQQHRLDRQHVRVLRNRLFKHFRPDAAAVADFPLRDSLRCHALELYRRFDSEVDGATKLLFRTDTGMLIESVILRIATGRTTLCVSSQVGCAAACDFCATGKMGIARSLHYTEILDQVLQAGQLLAAEGGSLDNIVFMGMGEPFHNEANLIKTIQTLTAPDHFNRSPSRILVSTVGVSDAMLRMAQRFPKVNLALSLHSADQSTREQIIPLARRYPLEQLRDTIANCNRIQEREVMIEYLMLSGVNDAAIDIERLTRWLDGLCVHLNLIPYNPIEDAPHLRGTAPERIVKFADAMKSHGVKTTVRYSLGRDIDAACGQLVRKENRAYAMNITEMA
ncbi:23S rRNA (adenine(2503)-C(2))-methyltransferase RlmN [Aporhodopirellula aestuarii]|uniref:23S rRNA (Adenine(2503)-C(2))-methyltransferase RlmN n=1 Tax=Aporhodopirellula aestuarii TaxID=2950107 RepID=A0ABT0U4A1_9BACT|nr:23S rRNA (adenine(2503)-C(2))-methyltransferase RlmN [Aporhodopirellula aestuarii]MCM2371727.1 23S rRNA (adenine(2503)-C(2))-methyltransferase RlmN [Aporhodopirellula aestuarii]